MATYINMSHKPANKFRMVQLDSRLRFNQLLEENENIVPCSLYVNKEDGIIYFVEEQTGPILDGNIYDISINDSPGLLIGNEAIGF